MLRNYNPIKEQYPYVLPDLEDWPIVQLTAEKDAFLKQVNQHVIDYFLNNYSEDDITDEIARTIYLERKRSKEEPWRVDPKSERKFWNGISKLLVKRSLDKDDDESQAVLENNRLPKEGR
jgi:glycerol-3-phosphate O-acyltransferase